MSEQIGKHKGAVETLLHEKKELSRLLQIVNSQLQRHLSALEDQGVDTDEFINNMQQGMQGQQQRKGQRSQQDQRNQQDQQSQQGQSRQETRPRQDSQEPDSEEDVDIGDELENDSDSGNRDFNPMR